MKQTIDLSEGEAIEIGESIRLEFVRVYLGEARIAIDAPRDVPIWRAELLEHAVRHPPLRERMKGRRL
jgi:sRNA-binding carbon storage regulator CsrA